MRTARTAHTRLFIQNHGTLRTDIRWLVEGEDSDSLLGDDHDGFWFDCPTSTLIIDHADGLFLVDTSCPRNWHHRWRTFGADEESPYSTDAEHPFLDTAIARLGYQLSDFDAVVFTHLHFDHAGNAQLFCDLPMPLLVHQDEIAAFSAIQAPFADGYLAADLHGIASDRFHLVAGDRQLVSGVDLLELPGHSVGTMGVMVDLKDTGPVLYTGDAAHMEASYRADGRGDPGAWSAEAWARSVARLRDFERQGVQILCSHDPRQLEGGGWRMAPCYHQ